MSTVTVTHLYVTIPLSPPQQRSPSKNLHRSNTTHQLSQLSLTYPRKPF